MSLLGGLAALVAVCGHELAACEIAPKVKPAKVVRPSSDIVAMIQKRIEELLRPSPGTSSVPSRRIILQ